MAGYRDCLTAMARAAGRELTDEEVRAVFERIHKAALDIKAGRAEPEEVGAAKTGKAKAVRKDVDAAAGEGTADLLVRQAAERAAAELEAEAAKAEQRAYLQVLRLGARTGDAARLEASGIKPMQAVELMIARDYSGRTNIEALETRVAGYRAEFQRRLLPAWDALGDDFLGFFQDPAKTLLLVRELRGEDTGDALAKNGAKAFHEVAEEARKVFNSNGGAIGRLDDWGMPQHHSQEKVALAGKDAWVEAILPRLDTDRYTNELTGVRYTEAELREFLGHAWDTIATNGLSKMVPGKGMGFGARANRHGEHRQIHFKDAESQIDYWREFGDRTLVEILHSHVDQMAKDIAMVEQFGPNPNLTFATLRDAALQRSAMGDAKLTERFQSEAVKLTNLYNYAAGRVQPTFRPWLRKTADAISHANVFGKLGGAAITSFFGDKTMLEAVSHLNNLPAVQRWRNELALLSPSNATERRLLQRQGLMLEGIRSGLQRFGEELGTSSTSGKIANAVMRLTGMQAVNDFRKAGFALTLMDSIGTEIRAGKTWEQLADADGRTLRNYGITKAEWDTWRLARLVDMGRGNDSVLTPEAIQNITDAELEDAHVIAQGADPREAAAARRNAIVKLLGAVNTESEFAIVTPGWRERALFYGGLAGQRGTVPGEIWRSVLQFKSFPWAFFQRSMDAVANQDTPGSKAALTAYIVMSTTLAGAMTMQAKEMLAGKDPRKMMDENWYKFWASAFIYGGALGFYGDFLYSVNQTRYGSGPIEALAGPTMGPLLELALVQPLTAAKKALEGKETRLGAQTLQDLKGYVPGGNAWYAKAALDHLIWQQALEALSPGYLGSIRRRTQKEYDQRWWWDLGEPLPERAPALGEAIAR
jgi:hypothetical protein